MLVSDFTVKSRLKILNDISMEFIECLKRCKATMTLSVHQGRPILIVTGANLLDTK